MRTKSNEIRANKAFTLIELLVVIAIIALLAAILFPVFGRARENARRTSCASNLKQIGTAMMQYSQDYDESIPGRNVVQGQNMGAVTCNAANEPCSWVIDTPGNDSLLDPYLKGNQIALCPSQTKRTVVGYGYNNNVGGGTKIARLQKPSEMMMFADDQFGARIMYSPTSLSNWGANYSPTMGVGINVADFGKTFPFGRHLEGVNVVYMDGHVKWNQAMKMYNNGSNKTLYDGS